MQVLYRGQSERLFVQFRDSNYVPATPSGSISVTIQFQDGTTKVSNAASTLLEPGKYFYTITPDVSWKYGYYGAWWRDDVGTGIQVTQDVPNVFKIEEPAEGIIKGVMLERIRSMLYMHADMQGFANKFPRDRELLDHLQTSLNWWNAHPPAITFLSFLEVPEPYLGAIEQGAVILALESLGIFEAGKHFIYNDNGISLTRDRTQKYQGWWTSLFQKYAADIKAQRTKYAMDHVTMKGSFSSTTGFPRSLSRALRGVSKFA